MNQRRGFSFRFPQSIAAATKVEGLRGRARAAGIADFACEAGHGKYATRFTWHLHCGREVAELFLQEIAAAADGSSNESFRSDCAATIAAMRLELDGADVHVPVQARINADGTRTLGT